MLPSDNILGEHVRLGSQIVILSRTFKVIMDANSRPIDLKEEVQKVRDRLDVIDIWMPAEHLENRKKIDGAVDAVIAKITGRVL